MKGDLLSFSERYFFSRHRLGLDQDSWLLLDPLRVHRLRPEELRLDLGLSSLVVDLVEVGANLGLQEVPLGLTLGRC